MEDDNCSSVLDSGWIRNSFLPLFRERCWKNDVTSTAACFPASSPCSRGYTHRSFNSRKKRSVVKLGSLPVQSHLVLYLQTRVKLFSVLVREFLFPGTQICQLQSEFLYDFIVNPYLSYARLILIIIIDSSYLSVSRINIMNPSTHAWRLVL